MERLFTVPLKLRDPVVHEMYTRGSKQGSLTTDTYFGCLDCHAYSRHTSISAVRACVKGKGKIQLFHVDLDGKKTLVGEGNSVTASIEIYREGYFYISCDDVDQNWPEDIWYEGEGAEQLVKLAVIICTYKREETVLKNLRLLSHTIKSDPLLANTVEIICVDNGRTLTEVPDGVRLILNPNYGGSGGYARGMMEAEGFTHLWLMDDDIAFEPTLPRRVVTFLKYRKRDTVRLAAGMFSFEQPTIQREATAVFDGYTFHSNCMGLDFREAASLLMNRIPEGKENLYGGWWSMVVPNTGDLPMPFFIKLDDVEYGLRGQHYATMNGFGVWHEAFGNKGNAWTEYYTTRNTLIIQSMYPELGHSVVKTMGVRLLKALAYDEPKCMTAALRGVEDYVKGSEALGATDPEEKHREVMGAFGARLAADMTRQKMVRLALKNILKPGNWRSVGMFVKALVLLRKKPTTDWATLRTRSFWESYLSR